MGIGLLISEALQRWELVRVWYQPSLKNIKNAMGHGVPLESLELAIADFLKRQIAHESTMAHDLGKEAYCLGREKEECDAHTALSKAYRGLLDNLKYCGVDGYMGKLIGGEIIITLHR